MSHPAHGQPSQFPDELRAELARLIIQARGTYPADAIYPIDNGERELADNVRRALHQLGHDVNVAEAAAFWEAYSLSLNAGWLDGAETVETVVQGIITYCRNPRGLG